jgi:hypothetical protein
MAAKPRPGNGDPHHAKAARAAVAHAQQMTAKADAEIKAHKASSPKATPNERKSFNRETQARDKAGKFRPAPVKK